MTIRCSATLRSIACGTALLACSACLMLPIPHQERVTPLYTGTVVDDATGLPVEGVTVVVEHSLPESFHQKPLRAETRTDANGHFSVAVTERETWLVVVSAAGERYCSGGVTFTHPDYEPVTRHTSTVGSVSCGKSKLDVRLERRNGSHG